MSGQKFKRTVYRPPLDLPLFMGNCYSPVKFQMYKINKNLMNHILPTTVVQVHKKSNDFIPIAPVTFKTEALLMFLYVLYKRVTKMVSRYIKWFEV